MEKKITFKQLCDYAMAKGYTPRQDVSNVKDYTQHYFGMYNQIYMALYQGERRIVRGHDKPEVCWVCIDYNGRLYSIPSRTIRTSPRLSGFGLSDEAKTDICDFLGITRKYNELQKLLQEEA